MIILGLETSCDETAASILEVENERVKVLSSIISSQIELHAKWGGVVPNLAAREHLKNILPVIETALKKAKKKPTDLDLIAVTNGPGLIPALLIGTTTAKTLSYLWRVPLIGIHHIEGHIYANFISHTRNKVCAISNFQFPISNKIPNSNTQNLKQIKRCKNFKLEFPILCLVVSGGHTQLVLMKKHLDYEIIGETVDDAVGEAYDKVARILNLGYPGGPAVAKLADSYAGERKFKITLPRPMLKSANFNFSFSGLKTAVLYATKKNPENLKNADYLSEMCQEFQTAVTDVLVAKTICAAKKYAPKTILLAGGVSANVYLRKRLELSVKENLENTACLVPELVYSMDNAAMIAMAGYYRWKNASNEDKKSLGKSWESLETSASLRM
ncbi:MAG: tRNA (adenosine(37)-N6)-threonylcarbamoyltransferase complex transferase subunit TsaD [Candidatus Moranbacteria bacterium]|nr:tRNA (adenosine(37)-N6)-threonylcarbamoyltransferase complex transferase subunit TsaD [Candidatus Moranbacteria bacterium]